MITNHLLNGMILQVQNWMIVTQGAFVSNPNLHHFDRKELKLPGCFHVSTPDPYGQDDFFVQQSPTKLGILRDH